MSFSHNMATCRRQVIYLGMIAPMTTASTFKAQGDFQIMEFPAAEGPGGSSSLHQVYLGLGIYPRWLWFLLVLVWQLWCVDAIFVTWRSLLPFPPLAELSGLFCVPFLGNCCGTSWPWHHALVACTFRGHLNLLATLTPCQPHSWELMVPGGSLSSYSCFSDCGGPAQLVLVLSPQNLPWLPLLLLISLLCVPGWP